MNESITALEILIDGLKTKLSQLPRSEKTRKLQITITNLETSRLWLIAASNED